MMDEKPEKPTLYANGTVDEVQRWLEYFRGTPIRLKITSKSGRVQRGRISRSMGWGPMPIHVPLICDRGRGGHCIDSADIIRIEYSNQKDGGLIWQAE